MQRELRAATRALQMVSVLIGASTASRADVQRRTLLEIPATEQWHGAIYSARFSPDGKLVAALIYDNNTTTFRLWDARRAVPLSQWNLRYLNNFAFSPDGREIVTISGSQQRRGIGYGFAVEIRAARSGRLIRTLVPTGSVQSAFSSLAWSGDGIHVAVGGGDGRVRVWNRISGKQRVLLAPYSFVNALAFSPDGKYLSAGVGADDGTSLYLWTLRTGRIKQVRLSQERHRTLALTFSPDGRRLLTRRTFRADQIEGTETAIYSLPSLSGQRVVQPPTDETASNAQQIVPSVRNSRFAYPAWNSVIIGDTKAGRIIKQHKLAADTSDSEDVLALTFTPQDSLQWITTVRTETSRRISLWNVR